MDHGTTVRPVPAPRLVRAAALLLALGLPALLVTQQVRAEHREDLVRACQDEYGRVRVHGETARAARTAGDEAAARAAVEAYVREVRRVPVCYRDDERALRTAQELERGLREGPLVVPPEPLGVA